ncbi:MAG: hypothetical protein R3346_02650 [Candidatus Spechtbacterales bacterium]|nr:hypothetical protein [Candidatus Spechtbacterales bacterium]
MDLPTYREWREKYKEILPNCFSAETAFHVFSKIQEIFIKYTSIDSTIDLGTPLRASCVISEIFINEIEDSDFDLTKAVVAYALCMVDSEEQETYTFGLEILVLAVKLWKELNISGPLACYVNKAVKAGNVDNINETYHLAAINIKSWLDAGRMSPFLYWHFRALPPSIV